MLKFGFTFDIAPCYASWKQDLPLYWNWRLSGLIDLYLEFSGRMSDFPSRGLSDLERNILRTSLLL